MKPRALLSTLLLLLVECRNYEGRLEVENVASVAIDRITINVCGQAIRLEGIAPSTSALASYRVSADGHYDVWVEFRGGSTLQGSLGYVTTGMNFSDHLLVSDSEIRLERAIK